MNIAGHFGEPKYLSASGVVNNKPGALIGFLCITSSTGTISLYDNASAASGTKAALPPGGATQSQKESPRRKPLQHKRKI